LAPCLENLPRAKNKTIKVGTIYPGDAKPTPIYSVSDDEKPGIQAIGLTAPDLPPVPGKESSVARGYEYVRHGTLSILAALDLHSGEIIANVEPRRCSCEFI